MRTASGLLVAGILIGIGIAVAPAALSVLGGLLAVGGLGAYALLQNDWVLVILGVWGVLWALLVIARNS